MGKSFWKSMVLVVSAGFLLTLLPDGSAQAGVNIGVNIEIPSPFVFPAPPPVVVIPGTYVYMVPDVDVQVLFFRGHWYRPHGGRWYRGRSHDGPWVHIGPKHVPRALAGLPPGYHRIPPGRPLIPHGHLKANWERWERENHWKKHKEWRGPEGGKKAHKGGKPGEKGRSDHERFGKHGGKRE